MSKLLKNIIWPVIFLGVLLAIVYYRAFLFTPDFNSPIDAVVNDASKSLDFEIPSHQLADNETPVYEQLFGKQSESKLDNNEVDADHASNDAVEIQAEELPVAENQQIIETEPQAESKDDLSIDKIVLAVKTT
ncbi:hypothetical protein MNBD_GAMMA08-1517, partial [hydrothermal vent metagenome]